MVYRGRLEDSAGNNKGQVVVSSLSLAAEESTISKKDIIELLVRRACT
jgi:hypothetical protein